MTDAPAVKLVRFPDVLATAALALTGAPGAAAVVGVEEARKYDVTVSPREADVEYRARVGDEPLAPPAVFDRQVSWTDRPAFVGVRGRAEIVIESRGEAGDRWTPRARLPVYVSATKLSQDRYETMTAELRGLAAGLLFDLYSKSLTGVAFGPGRVAAHSNLVELRLLHALWSNVAGRLRDVSAAPVTRLTAARVVRWTDGRDRLDARAVARLAAAGTDPRRRGTPRPFQADIRTARETADTIEHRELRGLLDTIGRRLDACESSILAHVRALEEDRGYRDGYPAADGQTLFDLEDAPRLGRLAAARDRVAEIRRQVRRAAAAAPFGGLTPAAPTFASPVFSQVEPYRAIRDHVRAYLRSAAVVLEDGAEERLKSTHRLYEQWVFFQIASALRAAGLRCASHADLFASLGRRRFSLDLDRGARLTFHAADGRAAVLRYEPWILRLAEAEARGDAVYRSVKQDNAAWSPDVLLEFYTPGNRPALAYAVVFDAKYTGRVRQEDEQDTDKYLRIRRTGSNNSAVRQVWRVCPDPELGVWLRDDMEWGDAGPNVSLHDEVLGEIGLAPAAGRAVAERVDDGWIPEPSELLTDFVRALLRFVQFPAL